MKINLKHAVIGIAMCIGVTMNAQTTAIQPGQTEQPSGKETKPEGFKPEIHGILRDKYEFQPALKKTAWFKAPSYSARVQVFPVKGFALIPSIQHQKIANRKAAYTSFSLGAFYEAKGFHAEAEFMRKVYVHNAFTPCNAANVMLIYRQALKHDNRFLSHLSYLLRYDYMDNHADGKQGFDDEDETHLKLSDAARHRLTAGITLSVGNRLFPTDIRFNYEKYFYPNDGTPKESEQDKLVAELMIRF